MIIHIVDSNQNKQTVRGEVSLTDGKLYVEGTTEPQSEHYFHIFQSVSLLNISTRFTKNAMIELQGMLPALSGTGEGPKTYTIVIF